MATTRLTPSHASRRNRNAPARGFTLVELLVVIAIIAGLVALLIPMVLRATSKASAARVAADLQAIGNALDAYKLEFGDYPRHRVFSPTFPRKDGDSGANILTWALVGPYDAGQFVEGNAAGPFDGAAGPGFRVRYANPAQGKVNGPYLDMSKFKLVSSPQTDYDNATRNFQQLVDGYGNPILYFPARPGVTNIQSPGAVPTSDTIIPNFPKDRLEKKIIVKPNYIGSSDSSLYNLEDNKPLMTARLRTNPRDNQYLGDGTFPDTDKMRSQFQFRLEEGGSFSGPYILWSAGADGVFFTADDVTNFSK